MHKISKKALLDDIRSGMGDFELKNKYRLSDESLERLMEELVERKAVGHWELYENSALYRKLVDRLAPRESQRIRVLRPIYVYHDERSQKGIVRDVSDNGIRVVGIKAAVGQTITLRLPPEGVGKTTEPIEFTAECRWSKILGKHKKYVMCGFEITGISHEARISVEELTRLLVAEIRGSDRSQERVIHVQLPREVIVDAGAEPHSREFSGKVEGVGILDLVQFLMLIGKTTVLHVTSLEGMESQLYLKNGNLVHAELGLRGREAFFGCMNFPGGEFVFGPWCEPNDYTIRDSGDLLVLEAARRRDELRP